MEKNLSLANALTKPNLSEGEQATLERFRESNSHDLVLIKKLMVFYMEDLKNIMNIDPKGNVGLQTCSRQEAFKVVNAVAEIISPDIAKFAEKKEVKEGISQWR